MSSRHQLTSTSGLEKILRASCAPSQPPSVTYPQGAKQAFPRDSTLGGSSKSASTLEEKRSSINTLPLPTSNISWGIAFVREGTIAARKTLHHLREASCAQHATGRCWQMVFPSEIATTTLRPDLMLWSPSLKKLVDLTVPWEDSMEEAYERKHLRYSELAADARHRGWNAEVRPVEVGCRGFVGTLTTKLLRDLGVRGQSQHTAIKAASEAAERSTPEVSATSQQGNSRG
ncbi:hypothetical protein D5F01_LYC16136 [Larimichthys crocea]|uniref:Uncharacterized protein n=1 Tax=Larimichthys crocea TaxID=215358 RepID=A0A6G0I061_LARCR|nr:hypothetical protein D5F01_LYC16136 [Larimichthys crocea]